MAFRDIKFSFDYPTGAPQDRYRLADAARRYARRGAHEVQAMQLDVTFSDQRTNSESEAYGDPTIGENAANTIGKGSMDQWRKR
jgi:hypothetical protein